MNISEGSICRIAKHDLGFAPLKSLVTIRMNEIFPCLACYRQKLIFFVRKSRQINISPVKGSGEDEIGTIFFKSDIYDIL